MEKWDGSDVCLKSAGPAYEESKEILLKVKNVNSEDLNCSSSGSSSELLEETLQKIKTITDESTTPGSELPEGTFNPN